MQNFIDCFRAAEGLVRRVPSTAAAPELIAHLGFAMYFNDGEEK